MHDPANLPMNVETSMVSYYARRAAEYERIYQKPERQQDLQMLQRWVEREFADRRVLELACGTGYWTEILARSATSVVACDLNEAVLDMARSKPMSRARVEFLRADAYALPDLSRTFNAGLAAFWWSHVPINRLPAFLQSFHRMFTPGAQIMFLDNRYVLGSSTPISRTDAAGNTYQTRTLADGSTHEVLKNFPSESELQAVVDGLATDLQLRLLCYYWILSYKVA
jgi:demethylmenaquinone methyltransferase/2-methoxy-6-polyprenyl-1,4-benzoquinol methylase